MKNGFSLSRDAIHYWSTCLSSPFKCNNRAWNYVHILSTVHRLDSRYVNSDIRFVEWDWVTNVYRLEKTFIDFTYLQQNMLLQQHDQSFKLKKKNHIHFIWMIKWIIQTSYEAQPMVVTHNECHNFNFSMHQYWSLS